MFIAKSNNIPIGIDISDLSIKFAQLAKKRDRIIFQTMGKLELPKGIIENGEIKDKHAAADALHKLLSKPIFGSPSGSDVIVSLPETRTFIKLIKIEKSVNKLNDIIDSEIEKNIPITIKEVYYDWQIVGEDQDQYEVLVGAAPKNIVEQYIALMNSVKLSIQALEIEAVPICRCLLAEESPKYNNKLNNNYAIIDIGAKRTSLIIYAKNTIVTSISLPISGDVITSKIAQTLDLKRDQAEKAKIVCGLDKNVAKGIINDILSEMVNDLITRINDAFDFYLSHYPEYSQINKILLCGGGSNIKDLETIIKSSTGIETASGNPFINVSELPAKLLDHFKETHNLDFQLDKNTAPDKALSIIQNSSSSYSTAIGLALRNFYIK